MDHLCFHLEIRFSKTEPKKEKIGEMKTSFFTFDNYSLGRNMREKLVTFSSVKMKRFQRSKCTQTDSV